MNQTAPASAALLIPAPGLGPHSAELRASGTEDAIWQPGVALNDIGGRAAVQRVTLESATAIVRHYRRGGWLARLLADRYWFNGSENTRCFCEFRLLAALHAHGLPVPRPLAARYQQQWFWYRADLATVELAGTRSLHRALSEPGLDRADLGARVGATIARFHRLGVWHADLNAHNILVDGDAQVYLIDFDRGELRAPQARWQQANLQRLQRSCQRLGHAGQPWFAGGFWAPLLAAHGAGLR